MSGVEVVVHAGHALTEPPSFVEHASINQWRSEARAALNLPDAPVIACGHQSEAWHPGILAKNMWVQGVAQREHATAVHVMVDQDGFDGMHVEWPFQRPDGWWGLRGHRFLRSGGETASMRCPAEPPRSVDAGSGVLPDIVHGLDAIQLALSTHSTATDAAMQGTLAMLSLAEPWLAMPHIVRASDLMQTSFAKCLIEAMLHDPVACATTLNKALVMAPRSARPLRVQRTDAELPLWLLGPQGQRQRANAAQTRAALASGGTLLPRAFFMSVIARTALADLFVHGLGGSLYEPASDAWMRSWRGWIPPSFAMVTANVRLPLTMPKDPMPQGVPFRRAWCDPHLLQTHSTGPSPERQRALAMISSIPHRDPRRRSMYEELIRERNTARLHRSEELESLHSNEAMAGAARIARTLAARRSWCFALVPKNLMTELRDALLTRLPA